jgi:LysM repeat protein
MAERFGLSVKKSEGKERTPSAGKMRPGVSPGMDMGSPVEQVLHLQRTIGNRAVTRLVESGALQARLRVGAPNDIYEQEAERIADRVMAMTTAENPGIRRQTEEEEEEIQAKPVSEHITPLVQRQVEPEEEEEEIQAKTSDTGTPEVTPDLESRINALKSGGQPLPASTRAFFEPRFGTDFSHVRLHTDTNAANTAQSLNARAFTTGRDIVFGSGQYSPDTSSGKQLLAHELTHVVQQRKESETNTVNKERILTKKGESKERTYRVKKGESLRMIAKKFNVTADALKIKNASKLRTWKTKKGDIQGFNSGEIIIIPSQKYLISEKSQEINYMVFDGKKVSWKDSSGKTVFYVNAISGLKKNNKKIKELIQKGRKDIKESQDYTDPKYQNLSDVGPIPEGEFTLILVKGVPFDKRGGGWGLGGWLLHSGFFRKMAAKFGLARSGFFLHHDGGNDGTSGCIGIKTKEETQVIWDALKKYQKAGQKSIVVKVEY